MNGGERKEAGEEKAAAAETATATAAAVAAAITTEKKGYARTSLVIKLRPLKPGRRKKETQKKGC